VLLGVVLTIGLPIGSAWLSAFPFGLLGGLVPIVIGVVLVVQSDPKLAGTGLGMLIGWALALLIGFAACVALLAAYA
jgi:hypothetical protein